MLTQDEYNKTSVEVQQNLSLGPTKPQREYNKTSASGFHEYNKTSASAEGDCG